MSRLSRLQANIDNKFPANLSEIMLQSVDYRREKPALCLTHKADSRTVRLQKVDFMPVSSHLSSPARGIWHVAAGSEKTPATGDLL